MDLKDKRGVEVVSVDQGSFAEDIGIVEKDVIISINRQPVSSGGRHSQDPGSA